jgi:hypothetical protein
VEGIVTSEHHNQSLPGLVSRLMTHSPSFSTYVDQQYTPTHYHNLLALDPEVARWLVKGCMGLFALLVVWSCRTPAFAGTRGDRDGWRLTAEFGVVLLGMLLFSERTWKHHYVTLVVPFAVLCYYLAVCPSSRGVKAYLAASLVVAQVFIMATSTALAEDKGGSRDLYLLFAKKAQVYGAFIVANLVLLTALVVLLRRPDAVAQIGLAGVSTAAAKTPAAAQAGAA